MKRTEIESHATQILRDHNLLNIPVDPLIVANALNIKVMNAVFSEQDKSGVIVKRENNFSILLNSNEPPGRKRFTIAHEIGHGLLHMGANTEIDFIDTEDNFRSTEPSESGTWNAERQREWEANVFASALLMNEELLRKKYIESCDPTILAWTFQVSPNAMIVRLTQLGLLKDLP
jgi:Zn-dependent peptidase ImmA (M78 family)